MCIFTTEYWRIHVYIYPRILYLCLYLPSSIGVCASIFAHILAYSRQYFPPSHFTRSFLLQWSNPAALTEDSSLIEFQTSRYHVAWNFRSQTRKYQLLVKEILQVIQMRYVLIGIRLTALEITIALVTKYYG